MLNVEVSKNQIAINGSSLIRRQTGHAARRMDFS
uniref:Uncharacterized protein n=1 Tax=Anguilla anguilla TaxID=7936 RepID=A0A0E9WWH5_ANGAN